MHIRTLFTYISLMMSLALTANAEVIVSGNLSRKADLGFRVSQDNQQLVVKKLVADSAATKAGLREGDVIERIQSRKVVNLLNEAAALRKHVGNSPLRLDVMRDNLTQSITFTPPPRSFEAMPGADSYYGVADMPDGARLRTLVAVPEGTKKKLPAIFLVQWVSCSSLEYNARSGASKVQTHLLETTNRAFIRVERSSNGDSEGPACHQLDYDTELLHYYHAFKQIQKHPHIDPHNIILYGSSLGSTMAPLLAERLWNDGIKVKGIMVQGGGGVTYLERMLSFERAYFERRPDVDPVSIHQEIIDRTVFYTEYFIKQRHPVSVSEDSPAMARVFNDIRGLDTLTQYGRPHEWHQQAAKHNFLKAWHTVAVPVLVVFNEFDQFELEHGHQMIVNMINRWRPATATYVMQKGIGHSNYQFTSMEEAYKDEAGTPAPLIFANVLSKWINSTFQ